MVKAADTVGVKDDPVTGWAIAGGIGVATAAACWAACPVVAGWFGFGGTSGAAAGAGAGAAVPELVGAGVG